MRERGREIVGGGCRTGRGGGEYPYAHEACNRACTSYNIISCSRLTAQRDVKREEVRKRGREMLARARERTDERAREIERERERVL